MKSSDVTRKIFVREHCSNVRQDSSPCTADRNELMLWVATIGMRLGGLARTYVRRRTDPVAGGFEAVVLVEQEQEIASRLFRRGGDAWDARHDGPFGSPVSASLRVRGEGRIQADWKVQGHDLAPFEKVSDSRQRCDVLLAGFPLTGVGRSRRVGRAANLGVIVE